MGFRAPPPPHRKALRSPFISPCANGGCEGVRRVILGVFGGCGGMRNVGWQGESWAGRGLVGAGDGTGRAVDGGRG